jgi:hypothetical protein
MLGANLFFGQKSPKRNILLKKTEYFVANILFFF